MLWPLSLSQLGLQRSIQQLRFIPRRTRSRSTRRPSVRSTGKICENSLARSLSDAIDELEELRALFSFFPFFLVLRLTCSNSTNGGAEVDDVSYAVGCGVVGGRGRGLGRLRRRRREISSISKWSYVSSRPPPSAPAVRPSERPSVCWMLGRCRLLLLLFVR